ncbi:MAG: 6-carboxytetrahydropterin synthase [Bacteroidales bacterium]|nr:6-carboxytetrahydropterin synthase [Bacteroidales bacterium]
MTIIRVTKEFDFEMAHALWNYDGACKNIHGHSYRLYVTISGMPLNDESNVKFGMVMDFKDLKSIVKNNVINILDHSLVVYRNAAGPSLDQVKIMYEKVHVFDFQPTCENLVTYIAEILGKKMPDHVALFSVKLYETATSFAEWYASDNNS